MRVSCMMLHILVCMVLLFCCAPFQLCPALCSIHGYFHQREKSVDLHTTLQKREEMKRQYAAKEQREKDEREEDEREEAAEIVEHIEADNSKLKRKVRKLRRKIAKLLRAPATRFRQATRPTRPPHVWQ